MKWLGFLIALMMVGIICMPYETSAPKHDRSRHAAQLHREYKSAIADALSDPDVAPLGMTVDYDHPDPTSPMTMSYKDGTCTLLVNESLFYLLTEVSDADTIIMFVKAVTIHEAAHCKHAREMKTVALINMTRAAKQTNDYHVILQMHRLSQLEESYADVAGLVWVLNRHPDEFESVFKCFKRLRADSTGTNKNTHNTTPFLEHINSDILKTDRNIFDHADDVMFNIGE